MTRRPSQTATKIARFMVLTDAIPRLRDVLPVDAAATVEKILRHSGAVPTRLIGMMRKPATIRFASLVERWTSPGQLLWFAVRKRWFAEKVEAAIAAGAKQLLVVGAGLDPLAVITAANHPDVLCVEIDAPPTAEPKRAGVQQGGLARANHLVCAADLSKTRLQEVLRTTPWRTDVQSVVVAEGLLMYLRPRDVKGFFTAAHELTGPGTRIAFSSVDADDRGRPHIGALDAPIRFALRLIGEAMHWGLRPQDASAFLSELGYRALEQPTMFDLRRDLLDPRGLHEEPLTPYEHLVLAEKSKR